MTATIWSGTRKSPPIESVQSDGSEPVINPVALSEGRSRFQKDYDRVLFSTPVRRLSDKTQVWPMEQNDGVRTRLTHSHEVANLARSIGTSVYKKNSSIFDGADLHETIQPILLAIGLAHDLGNPPFGHQGEVAIGNWFEKRKRWIFTHEDHDGATLSDVIPNELWREFLEFDGNPQSLRLLTKLQTSVAFVGLDLTAATLAASLKYPVSAANVDKNKSTLKKVGYFESERALVEWMRDETGLLEKQRHPLTWIMEACDDIAYSVLDVDDAMKKCVVSPDDVFAILIQTSGISKIVLEQIRGSFAKVMSTKRRPEITRDIKIGYLKAHFLDALVAEATNAYIANSSAIVSRKHDVPLMEGSHLCDALKGLAKQYAFGNSGVLKMEALGAVAVDGLLSEFWSAIRNRKDPKKLISRRTSARNAYIFSLISHNYLEDAERSETSKGPCAGMRYRELRLLTDMISGMTDTFAIKLWGELRALA